MERKSTITQPMMKTEKDVNFLLDVQMKLKPQNMYWTYFKKEL